MIKKVHEQKFKLECVAKLELLKELGKLELDGVQIKNVRELVNFLGISSFSIYKWNREIKYDGNLGDLNDAKDFIKEHDKKGFEPKELAEILNDSEILLEGLNREPPEDFFADPDEVKTHDNGIFNGRFYAWFGAGLNIPYASRNRMDVNMMKIGMELMKRSGLVDCDKIKRSMKVL